MTPKPDADLSEFASSVQQLRLDLSQLDQEPIRAKVFQAHLGDALLGAARFGRALVQPWNSPAHSITGRGPTSRPSARWRGSPFGVSDLLIAGAEAEIELVSQRGFSLADIANKWGFWHLGQFAEDYRLLFGELPSETYGRNQSRIDLRRGKGPLHEPAFCAATRCNAARSFSMLMGFCKMAMAFPSGNGGSSKPEVTMTQIPRSFS
jgi:hypothetical protein